MPISPKEILHTLDAKDNQKVSQLVSHFDNMLKLHYKGNNSVRFALNAIGVTDGVKNKLKELYIKQGWSSVSFEYASDWRDGDFYWVTITA